VPELLEVEYYRRLAEGCLGRCATGVDVLDPLCLRGPTSSEDLSAAIVGSRFSIARRRGKLLMLDGTGPTLGIRFGMTGGLVLDGKPAIERLMYSPPSVETRWVRFRVRFVDGGSLSLHDPRRFGRVELDPDEGSLGPDAMTVTIGQLRSALAARAPSAGPPLKARMQDQSRLAGLGNLLVDEILWRAGLSPHRPSGSLSDAELRRLHRNLRRTLDQLLVRGGSHTGDLMEQRRPGGRCPRDGTALERATVGGRTTWWCPAHQH